MQPSTRARLVDLNRHFYRRHAASFDATRQQPWPGWLRLLPHLRHSPRPLRVLDAGCGNGRFGVFLEQHLGSQVEYHGVDSDPQLLQRAAGHLDDRASLQLAELQDWTPEVPGQAFDLIGLFGVLHHLPGRAARRQLLLSLSSSLAPNGLLAATWWMLHETPGFERKALDWNLVPGIDLRDLEAGDTLLGWKGDSSFPRYCHFPDPAELRATARLPGLETLEGFRRDGASGADNFYRIYRRSAVP